MPEMMLKFGHAPTLRTVLMVEETLEELGFVKTRKELLRKLPRKIMFSTLTIILCYLQSSNKILVTLSGISWIEKNNNPKFKELLRNSVRVR
jgi:hypothetical protein